MHAQQPTDAELVRVAGRGDQAAFRGLFERHHLRIYRLCRVVGAVDHDEALDLVQETFVRAFDHLETLRRGEAFASFLASVARNVCATRRSQETRRLALHRRWADEAASLGGGGSSERPSVEAEDGYRAEALRSLVTAVIEELPPGESQETARLFYLEGLSTAAIAEKTGAPKSTVTTRLERFRGRVRQKLVTRVLDLLGEEP